MNQAYCNQATSLLILVFASLLANAAIDWDQVPAVPPLARNLHISSLGNCKCNVYNGVCDKECCCDADCDEKDKELYRRTLNCEGTTDSIQGRYCSDNALLEVFKVNHRDNFRIPGEELACIVYNNYPDRKDYLEVPTTANFGSAKRIGEWYSSQTTNFPGFRPGDSIPLHTVDSSSSRAEIHASPGPYSFLGIPSRSNNGLCGQLVPVPFMGTGHPVACYKQGATPAELCSALSYSNLLAILTPNAPVSSMDDVKPFLIRAIDANTLKAIGTFDPTPVFKSAFSNTPPPDVGLSKIETRYDSNTEVCSNAVVGLLRVIEYDSLYDQDFAKVTSCNATVFITDISMKQFTPKKTIVYQESVVFSRKGSQENIVPLELTFAPRRSAIPGYTVGSPVLAGVFTSKGTQEAIDQQVRGLSFPVGECLKPHSSVTVKFLHNLEFVACDVLLSEEELRGFCASSEGTSPLLRKILNASYPPLGITPPVSLSGIVDRIGMTMDASYKVPSSWTPINGIEWSTVKPYPYDTMQRRCENIITGIKYNIILSTAGAPFNPQEVIIGAQAVPTYGTWTFRGQDKLEKKKFQFRFSVKFDRNVQKEKIRSTRLVPPAILPAIDEDVFYPFRVPTL